MISSVMIVLMAAMVSGDPISSCSDDTQCAANQFCGKGNFEYSICQDCLSCSVANRQEGIRCPTSYYECGPCIDGFQLNKKLERCKYSHGALTSGTTTAPPTLDPGGNLDEEKITLDMNAILGIVLGIVLLVVVVIFLLYKCYRKFAKKRDSDPKVDDEESNHPSSAPLLPDSHYETQLPHNPLPPPPYSVRTIAPATTYNLQTEREALAGAEPYNRENYENGVQERSHGVTTSDGMMIIGNDSDVNGTLYVTTVSIVHDEIIEIEVHSGTETDSPANENFANSLPNLSSQATAATVSNNSLSHSQDSLSGSPTPHSSGPGSPTSDSRLDSGHASSNCIDQGGASSRASVSSAIPHSASLNDVRMSEFSTRLSMLSPQHGSNDSAFQGVAYSEESSQNDLYRDRRNSSDGNHHLDLRPVYEKRPLSTLLSEPEQKFAKLSHS